MVPFIKTLLILISFITFHHAQTYFGCYQQQQEATPKFNVNISPVTVDQCVDACEKEYFRYAILSEKCTCNNSVSTAITIDKDLCNTTCLGNSLQTCGGPNAESYYKTDVSVPGPVENLRIDEKSTNMSVHIAWEQPSRGTRPDMYEIKATVLKTFSTQMVISPSWRVQVLTTKFELPNLHPGTQYNISITPSDNNEYGGSSFILAETEIGIPDPPPEEPSILAQNATTATIELTPVENNNGPVTFYRVIVYFVGNEVLQEFDQKLLKGYKEAMEDGTPYYVTAELQVTSTQRFTVGDGLTYRTFFNAPLPKNRHFHISIGVVSQMNNVTRISYSITSHDQHFNISNVHIDLVEENSNKTLVVILTVACVIFGLLLIGSIVAYVYIRLRLDNRRQRLSDSHELQIQGPVVEVENQGFVVDNFENGGSFDDQLQRLIEDVNDDKKVTRNNLTLDIDNIIGTGQYGDVIRGNIRLNNTNYYSCQCQVHVISEDMEKRDQLTFLNEFSQLTTIDQHPNILSFFGICQTADWLYLIFEDRLMTLKKKLLDSRVPPHINNQRFTSLSEETIMNIMLSISQTMEFLVDKKIIQKNMCAHNITIDAGNQIKLQIFGPTLFDDGKAFETARWHAPEVLKYSNHTFKSNVWSFGILMWEICTLGATPYGNNIPTIDLFARIRNGARPEQSPFIFDDLYQLFLNCWELDAKERPSFTEITNYLKTLTTSINHVLSFDRRDGIILPYHLPLLEIKN